MISVDKGSYLLRRKPVGINNFGCGGSIESQLDQITRALSFLDLSNRVISVVSWSSSSLGRRGVCGQSCSRGSFSFCARLYPLLAARQSRNGKEKGIKPCKSCIVKRPKVCHNPTGCT